MHIHPSSPNSSLSEDDAAAKIQASFRGYRVRKQLKNSRKSKSEQQQNGHGGSNRNARDQVMAMELEERSAVKIQKLWKGFKTRKELKCASAAATKIQASFRGFKTRKELKSKVFGRKSQ